MMKVKIHIFGLLFLMVGPLWHGAGSQEQIRLIEDGRTSYRIMVGPGASPTELFAARELQGYLTQISGAFLPMDRGNDRPVRKHILVGTGAIARLGLEVSESHLGSDGFVTKTVDDKIILAGGSPRGTLYSVYAFLEMLGCRWLAPGAIGEVIPQLPTIVIAPMDHSERPSLTYRGFTNYLPLTYESQWVDWMGKNRMNYVMVSPANYADFKAILGGEIERRQMYIGVCFDSLTSEDSQIDLSENEPGAFPTPEAVRMAADQILEFIGKNPEVDIIELCAEPLKAEASEGQCAESTIEIAEIIHEKYPDKLVFPMVCKSRGCYRHSLGNEQCGLNNAIRNHLQSQLKVWSRVHIHESYMGSYGQNSLPFPILHTIASDLKYFDQLEGVDGIVSQCELHNWGTYGLNYYVFARMAWNANDDVEGIMGDYCTKYYGPASDPMKGYFTKLEDAMTAMEHFQYVDPPQLILKLLDEKSIADLEMEIQNAEGLANDVMNFDRIRKAQLSLDHAKLLWYALHHYFRALQLQELGDNKEASDHFQKAIEAGQELMAFLFRNIEEGVFIIPESHIFDYLEPLIADARDRKETLGTE